ncbi:MAG TPA: MFS transporter [Geminicoccaceae bacterium]|nr:MFS transporter [Geminicoccaceae bacterium]
MPWRFTLPPFLIMLLVGADEYALAPLLTPIGADLDVPPARAALLIAAFAAPYALLAPPLGASSDRFGRNRVLLPGLVLFIAGTVALALAQSFATVLGARLLAGAAAAALAPNAFAIVGDLADDKSRPLAMGFVQSGLTLGLILSPGLGGWAAGWIGWRAVFVAIALLGLLAALSLALLPAAEAGAGGRGGESPATMSALLRRPGAFAGIAAMFLWLGVSIGSSALNLGVAAASSLAALLYPKLGPAAVGLVAGLSMAAAAFLLWRSDTAARLATQGTDAG